MSIRVTRIRPIEKGNLKAFADVQIGEIEVRGFRVIQQPSQGAWVSVPQTEYTKDNEKRYHNIVVLSEDLKQKVDAEILRAWGETKNNGGDQY